MYTLCSAHGVTCSVKLYTLLLYEQTSVLDEACKILFNTWQWIKADGCNLSAGLSESTKDFWMEMNDGKTTKNVLMYMDRLSFINNKRISGRNSRQCLADDMDVCVDQISNDTSFIPKCKLRLLCMSVICNTELPDSELFFKK